VEALDIIGPALISWMEDKTKELLESHVYGEATGLSTQLRWPMAGATAASQMQSTGLDLDTFR